jgi:hypothetical protein
MPVFPGFTQTGTISPSENLIVDGVPPILASLAESVEGYSNSGCIKEYLLK